jgi:glycosyltransferase involved in cell wall biosynthesis
MNIGIDARQLVWPGIGKYTWELMRNLVQLDGENRYTFFYRSKSQWDAHPIEASNVQIAYVPFDIYAPAEHLWFFQAILRRKLDVFHSPSSLNVPALHPCKLVVSLHDIMFKEKPELIPSRLAALYFNLMNWWALRSAHRLLCISEFTRGRLIAYYPQHASKALVVHNGVSEEMRPVTDKARIEQLRNQLGIRRDYVLYVGTYKRHKNLLTLVRAYAALPTELKERYQLVFVRKQYQDRPEVGQLITELGLDQYFHPVDFVPEGEMATLYSGASVGVFPSIYEGFGLPLVEAMACGCPVVASDIPAFRETTAGRFPLVEPSDATAFTYQTQQILSDPVYASERRAVGLECASRFAWAATAEKALNVYYELCGSPQLASTAY